jgi:hypothetical protein
MRVDLGLLEGHRPMPTHTDLRQRDGNGATSGSGGGSRRAAWHPTDRRADGRAAGNAILRASPALQSIRPVPVADGLLVNIYIDRTRDGKIAVEVSGKTTLFDDRADAEEFVRRKKGMTLALVLSSLEPSEEPALPRRQEIPPDRVRVRVEPVALEGPKNAAHAVYRVVWNWRGKTRVLANFIADPTNAESGKRAARHARQFAVETQAQIEWEWENY